MSEINEKELKSEQLKNVSGGDEEDSYDNLMSHGYSCTWYGQCPFCHAHTLIGGNGSGSCMCGDCGATWNG